MSQFQIRDFSFSYAAAPERATLSQVNLSVEPGEYIVLCGTSGSGKTTLLRHLKSVLTPAGNRTGQILFNGTPLEQVPAARQAAAIGYVMQDPQEQIVTDKVWHEMAFGLECLGTEPGIMAARVAEMACYFGIQDWFHRDVAQLSGGQKQLLNLASVMAMQPEVLILDEPTSQLDPIAASDFLNTVRKINLELGTTVIITEHRLEDVLPYADRAVVMDGGRILADSSPRQTAAGLWQQRHRMFAAMPTPVRAWYGAGNTGECPLTVREGRRWLSGLYPQGEKRPPLPEPPTDWQRNALELKELWFRYERNGRDILRGVTGSIPEGCLYAIVGGNGAGKSTLLKALCGICKPYRGKIRLFGKAPEKYPAGSLFRNCLAMLPQDPRSLFVCATLRQELEEMCREPEAVLSVARLCRVDDLLERHPQDLSGGEQQRAALAKVLLTKPRLLLLDEPTKGIDNFFKETLADILCKLKEQGVTVLMVSHDVEFCARYADLVSMFFDGTLLTTDNPRRFFGGNSFYTTAANRMSRHVMTNAVTAEHIIARLQADNGA